MKRIGEVALAALAGFVAVAALVRPPQPARPAAVPGPDLPTDTTRQRWGLRVAEQGTSQARVVGFVEELTDAISRHRLTLLSAGLSYYGFFTMFPLAIAAVSIYGLLGDPEDLEQMFERFVSVFPEPTAQFLVSQLDSLFTASPSGLGVATGLALLATLWSASASTRALMIGINAVYEQSTVGRGLMVRLWALALTLALILVSIVLVGIATFLPTILDALGLEGGSVTVLNLVRWPVLLVVVAGGLTLLYRSSPGSTFKRDGWFSLGAVLATVAILVATFGFSWVVGLSDFAEVYGALTGLALLMIWFFTSGLILLVGAEVDRLLNERRRARAAAAGRR